MFCKNILMSIDAVRQINRIVVFRLDDQVRELIASTALSEAQTLS